MNHGNFFLNSFCELSFLRVNTLNISVIYEHNDSGFVFRCMCTAIARYARECCNEHNLCPSWREEEFCRKLTQSINLIPTLAGTL